MGKLSGKKIAILTEHGFEEVELTSPKQALEEAGATVHIISKQKMVKAWDHDHWSIEIPADANLEDARPEQYDGLLVPGGVMNPDAMRSQKNYVEFA